MAKIDDMVDKLSGKKKKKDPIHIKESHKGLLHKKLGVPEGEKIPMKKVKKAAKSKNPTLKKEAVFAENVKEGKIK